MTILLRQKPLPQVVRQIVQRDNGAWFDPEDMSTMYQDAAGTTPVTAMEQPVGLWLDKSKGLEFGSELVTNGVFDSNLDGWTARAGCSISTINGWIRLTYTGTGAARASYTQIPTAIGKKYKASFSVRNVSTSTSTSMFIYSDAFATQIGFAGSKTSDGSYTVFFTATTEATYIDVGNSASTAGVGAYVEFDNISVREIKGNHATQSITASRPTLSARKNILLATEALATQSVITLAATYTLSFTGTGSVTLSGTSTGTLTGNGTDMVSLTFTPTAGTLTLTVSGSVTKAQLELGAVAGPYQRVTTSTNYDGTAAPKYLRFDMVDDYLNLSFMNLYGGGTCSIVAAHDAVSQATDTYIISERSTTDIDPKYFPLRQLASGGNMDSYIVSDEGIVRLDTTGSALSGAKLAAIRSVVDTGNNIKLFKDGAVVAGDNYTRAGTLTLNNTTLGASVSTTTSNYANMRLYGLIVTKSALSNTDRRRCEQFLASRLSTLGVTLS